MVETISIHMDDILVIAGFLHRVSHWPAMTMCELATTPGDQGVRNEAFCRGRVRLRRWAPVGLACHKSRGTIAHMRSDGCRSWHVDVNCRVGGVELGPDEFAIRRDTHQHPARAR